MLALIIPMAVISFKARHKLNCYYSNESYLSEETQAMVAINNIRDVFGSADAFYIITPDAGDGIGKEQELVTTFQKIPGVDRVLSLSGEAGLGIPEFVIPDGIREQMVSGGYRLITIMLKIGKADSPESWRCWRVRGKISRIFDLHPPA